MIYDTETDDMIYEVMENVFTDWTSSSESEGFLNDGVDLIEAFTECDVTADFLKELGPLTLVGNFDHPPNFTQDKLTPLQSKAPPLGVQPEIFFPPPGRRCLIPPCCISVTVGS